MAEKAISQYINHPYKGPNFDLCQTKLKIELESCRRRFRTYSGAFWIGAQKKLNFFRGPVWPPLMFINILCFLECRRRAKLNNVFWVNHPLGESNKITRLLISSCHVISSRCGPYVIYFLYKNFPLLRTGGSNFSSISSSDP